ncbi:hypothetical protein QYE76_067030 [Lolium multiflorum]|uniref:DUF4283 domain-containing protein n=1 Tax=Lolium multiflorum TaxID=4521 RepID=A0AAD8SC11_LOLMU|nr:hypothetical protein QYE76_067030 [Lolium multiflorum]
MEALDDLLNRLGIEEDEIDDLIFEEEEAAPKEGIKWMALARVHTSNFFSPQTFEQHMCVAWSPAREVKFQHLEGNLFTIQCFCLGDWLKVEKGGPWLFRQNAVCIEKYDGLTDPESIDLNSFAAWIQIHKLLVGYRNEVLIKNLTEKKVGKVISVETNVNGAGNFVRVRVKLDVRKPLARFVSISREAKREFYQVKFEKIPKFCGACGFLGHTHLECGSGEHDEDKLKWGDFLKADWDTWHGRGVGGNRGGGRGGARGRGRSFPNPDTKMNPLGRGGAAPAWRHNALAFVDGKAVREEDIEDTASSPIKPTDMDTEKASQVDTFTKRRLDVDGTEEVEDFGAKDDLIAGQPIAMIMDGTSSSLGNNSDVDIDRKKRSKKDGANSTSQGSAASREESVRSQ